MTGLALRPRSDVAERPDRMPPIRQAPDDTAQDGARLTWFRELWSAQDERLLPRDRMIEEHVRMVSGDHWSIYHPGTGQYVDIAQFLRDDEKRWRQRPVINYLLRWYMLTHARMTENAPIVTWNPGPDKLDAMLAETLTQCQKLVWRDANMDDVVHRLMAWLVVAGEASIISRVDPDSGPWVPETADVPVPIVDPRSLQIIGMTPGPVPGVPLTDQWEPAVFMTPDGQQVPRPGVQPKMRRQGRIMAEVLTPLETRGEVGPRAWYDKGWHAMDCVYTPDECQAYFGVRIDPKQAGRRLDDRRARLLYGTGQYGAASARMGAVSSQRSIQDLVPVKHFWLRPRANDPSLADSPTSPGGRYVVMTDTQILYDGPRPIAYPFTSPIHTWEFLRLPGRPGGTTPQEALNGPQRSMNKARAIVMENANLIGSPKFVVDEASGISVGQFTNAPGEGYSANMRAGVRPVEWLTPPSLGESVYATISGTREDIEVLGNLEGQSGAAPTKTSSGELVKELRYNEDRYLGPTLRRAVPEFARMFQTWRAMMGVVWDRETVLSVAGRDRIVQTLTVYPELFETGTVNAEPDLESMLPEGRGERRQRVQWMYESGMFGPPGSPEAIAQYMERARFPHDSRVLVPAHVDWQTAEQENGELALGADPMGIPVLQWYDHAVHVAAHERIMKSREFLKFPPPVQQAFAVHREQHVQILAEQQARMARAAAANAPPSQPPQEGPPQ